jgi:hypothetical protein
MRSLKRNEQGILNLMDALLDQLWRQLYCENSFGQRSTVWGGVREEFVHLNTG